MRKVALLLVMLVPCVVQAAAAPELKSFRRDVPYSEAEYSYLWMDVYRIALWTDEARWRADAPYGLSITYRMGFSAEQLVERSCDEMQRHHPRAEALCMANREKLLRAMPGAKKGDRITAIRTSTGSTAFFKNGVATVEVADAEFTDAFFAIWLGENTSEPALRKQLLRER